MQQDGHLLCNGLQHSHGCSDGFEADGCRAKITRVWPQVPDHEPLTKAQPSWTASRQASSQDADDVARLHNDLQHWQGLHENQPPLDPPAAEDDPPPADAADLDASSPKQPPEEPSLIEQIDALLQGASPSASRQAAPPFADPSPKQDGQGPPAPQQALQQNPQQNPQEPLRQDGTDDWESRPPVDSVDVANGILRCIAKRLEKPKELTEQQKTAIELLLAGKTDAQVAKELDIHRTTLWRWRRKDEDFRRMLSVARERAFRDAGGRLCELVPTALGILQSRLAEGDYQAAVTILRLARVQREAGGSEKTALTQLLNRRRP